MNAVKKVVSMKISTRYLGQCAAMLLLVAVGYFRRSMLVNVVILAVLVVWGVYQNRTILVPLLSSLKMKVIRNVKE